MFVRYLTEQAHVVVRSEKKPRRAIQYKDLANAVARVDNLEFLSDIIPKTVQYKEIKEKKSRAPTTIKLTTGQTTLDRKKPDTDPDEMEVDESEIVDHPERTEHPARAGSSKAAAALEW